MCGYRDVGRQLMSQSHTHNLISLAQIHTTNEFADLINNNNSMEVYDKFPSQLVYIYIYICMNFYSESVDYYGTGS